jgi:hypothetical protein
MTFGTGWALFGLVALVPLVALHLRDRNREQREVPSLVLWRELDAPRSVGSRGLRLPQRPLLLLLEALVLVLFVLALAQPRATAATPQGGRVVVLDDSLLMSAPGRLAAAKTALMQVVSSLPSGRRVDIVLSQGSPRVIYRGSRAGVAAALRGVTPSLAPSSLPAALTLAAGLVSGSSDTITVIRAAGDRLPSRIDAASGELRTLTVGSDSADQGIFDAGATCGIGSSGGCEIQATLENFGDRTAVEHLTADVIGRAPLRFAVTVPAGGGAPITLGAVAGEQVTIRLDRADAVTGDNTAAVSVPAAGGLPAREVVTLVGEPGRALAVAQAFAAVPGVELRLLTPARYRSSDARSSALVILDNWLPRSALPPSPSVLLVDPPRIPDGRVSGSLTDTILAGTDATSPLLSGVDLSSLAIDRDGARAITLPRWIVPVAWSAAGPLIAAGDDGRTRVAVLGFEPSLSDLPQLAAFPLLAANIVGWASGWAPSTAATDEPMSVDATSGARSLTLALHGKVLARVTLGGGHPAALIGRSPGSYMITETGPHVSRHSVVTVNDVLPATAAGPVDLLSDRTPARPAPAQWSIWFLLAALVLLVIEWVYWLLTRPRPVRMAL